MKKLLSSQQTAEYFKQTEWDSCWISHPNGSSEESALFCYKLEINLPDEITAAFHVSADQRYLLYIDGIKQGEGPERGDYDNWFFETYELTLTAGKHTLIVLSWFIKYEDRPPVAQIFWRPGFILQSDTMPELFNTGSAAWKVQKVPGYSIDSPNHETYTGSRFAIHGKYVPWGFMSGANGIWEEPAVLWRGDNKVFDRKREFMTKWHLRPSILPAPYEQPIKGPQAVYCDYPDTRETENIRLTESTDLQNWQSFFDGNSDISIPSKSTVRIIADMKNYYCIYHKLITAGGADSYIRIRYAESLFDDLSTFEKGNRNQYTGKVFHGIGCDYYPGGNAEETYSTLWWIPGRYIEIYIETAENELVLKSFEQTETHYDYKFNMNFECSDPNIYSFAPIAYRAMEMCTHETLMDCPYYEQLMYVGDTRLELLTCYASSNDRYIAKKALDIFDKSIGTEGLTKSRYPSHFEQHIPTFSLFYAAMVYDYFMHTADINFLKELIHGVRGIMDFFRRHINSDGLLQAPIGWNFTDWVPGFDGGHNKYTASGVSGYYNIHYLYTLQKAAELEKMLGEDLLSQRYLQEAEHLKKIIDQSFWQEDRGLYSEDLEGTMLWEHTQCLAVLSGLPSKERTDAIMDSLKNKDYIHRTTIYFSHYLLEAAALSGRSDIFFDKLDFWSHLTENGFTTTPEAPNPTRSDCHAWGAHPLYHLQSNILGIKPALPGFESVAITPLLGGLKWAKGSMPHPKGFIECSYIQDNGIISGTIILPAGITGTLYANQTEYILSSGKNTF